MDTERRRNVFANKCHPFQLKVIYVRNTFQRSVSANRTHTFSEKKNDILKKISKKLNIAYKISLSKYKNSNQPHFILHYKSEHTFSFPSGAIG